MSDEHCKISCAGIVNNVNSGNIVNTNSGNSNITNINNVNSGNTNTIINNVVNNVQNPTTPGQFPYHCKLKEDSNIELLTPANVK